MIISNAILAGLLKIEGFRIVHWLRLLYQYCRPVPMAMRFAGLRPAILGTLPR